MRYRDRLVNALRIPARISVWIFLALVIVIAMTACIAYVDRIEQGYRCNKFAQMNPHLEFKYEYWAGGCLVKTPNGNWLSASKMHLIEKWEE